MSVLFPAQDLQNDRTKKISVIPKTVIVNSDVCNAQHDVGFDNAKFILAWLAVLGHFTFGLPALLIYSFHMPAFIMISGYFTKATWNRALLKKYFLNLIVPFLVFEIIYWSFDVFFLKQNVNIQKILTVPYFALWYLLSLFFWRVMLPMFSRRPFLSAVLIAVAALLLGYADSINQPFGLSRTLTLFPFFLVGFAVKKNQMKFEATAILKVTAVIFIGLICFFRKEINPAWTYGNLSYVNLGLHAFQGPVVRACFYVVGTLFSFCFIALIPRHKTFFSEMGARTLYPYVLHIPFLRLFDHFFSRAYFPKPALLGIAIVFSFLLTMALSSKYIKKIFHCFVEPFDAIVANGNVCRPQNVTPESVSGRKKSF